MGPSGSGKSTLMNILGCLDRPTEGTYWLDGEDVSGLEKASLAGIRGCRSGFVFQSYNRLASATALENVMLPVLYDRMRRGPDARREIAHHVLGSVGLGDRIHHRPQQLSGGQQQRVAIARALVHDPLLIMADEPTGNLDSQFGEEIIRLRQQLHAQGRTILMVTHDHDLADHTQRTVHMRDGKLERDEHNVVHRQPAGGEGRWASRGWVSPVQDARKSVAPACMLPNQEGDRSRQDADADGVPATPQSPPEAFT